MLSLITSTLGRKEPVERLLSSLNIQDRTDAELILVDQNAPPLEDALVSTLQRLSCTHIRNTGEVGLSKGRNRQRAGTVASRAQTATSLVFPMTMPGTTLARSIWCAIILKRIPKWMAF